jgi:hypothetical protein
VRDAAALLWHFILAALMSQEEIDISEIIQSREHGKDFGAHSNG